MLRNGSSDCWGILLYSFFSRRETRETFLSSRHICMLFACWNGFVVFALFFDFSSFQVFGVERRIHNQNKRNSNTFRPRSSQINFKRIRQWTLNETCCLQWNVKLFKWNFSLSLVWKYSIFFFSFVLCSSQRERERIEWRKRQPHCRNFRVFEMLSMVLEIPFFSLVR